MNEEAIGVYPPGYVSTPYGSGYATPVGMDPGTYDAPPGWVGCVSPGPAGTGESERRLATVVARGSLGTGLEAVRLSNPGGVYERKDGEDDVLGQRSPGCAKALESCVNRRQFVQIGARVALLRRCHPGG
jgi:hypothetical protein